MKINRDKNVVEKRYREYNQDRMLDRQMAEHSNHLFEGEMNASSNAVDGDCSGAMPICAYSRCFNARLHEQASVGSLARIAVELIFEFGPCVVCKDNRRCEEFHQGAPRRQAAADLLPGCRQDAQGNTTTKTLDEAEGTCLRNTCAGYGRGSNRLLWGTSDTRK